MALHVLCLDTSECAAINEDWGGARPEPRVVFQRRLATCISEAWLAGSAAGLDGPQAALVASHSGKAALVLPPSDRAALAPALHSLPSGGICSPCAALRLALLVARRFSSAHITVLVASPCDIQPAEAKELAARICEAAVRVDVVVLASREELGTETVASLALLSTADVPQQNSSSAGSSQGGGQCRVVFASPALSGAEPWQQLEAMLEQLEHEATSAFGVEVGDGNTEQVQASSETPAPAAAATAGSQARALRYRQAQNSSQHRGAPASIRRAPAVYDPLRRPRMALLAMRSGVHQPALCRHESLDWLGHLSPDGMMRPWLPTYASLEAKGKREGRQHAQQAVVGTGGAGGESCFLQVCPLPKWRTVLKVSAGLLHSGTSLTDGAAATSLHATASRQAATASSNNSAYASLSTALLHSLEALQLVNEAARSQPGLAAAATVAAPGSAVEQDLQQQVQQQAQDGGSASPCAAPTAGPVQLVADRRRGMLRVLQSVKEPHQLKVVWSPFEAAQGSGASPTTVEATFNMFEAPSSGAVRDGASLEAALSGGDGPAASTNAACQPIMHRGLELWEAGASFEVEAALHPGAVVSGRVLPSGAQVLTIGGSSTGGRGGVAAGLLGFWLQQRWHADCLPLQQQADPAAEVDGCASGSAASTAHGGGSCCPEVGDAGTAVAAGVLELLAAPPPVDLRQLRRDVKDGTLKVTPVTVGPLPGRFIQDIVNARAAIMRSMSIENCDTVHGEAGAPNQGDGSDASGSSSGEGRAAGAGTSEGAEAAPAVAAGGVGSAGPKRRRQESPRGVAGHHPRALMLSLLRGRLLHHSGHSGMAMQPSSAAHDSSKCVGRSGPSGEGQNSQQGVETTGDSSGGGLACAAEGPTALQSEGMAGEADPGMSNVATPFGTPLQIVPSSLVGAEGVLSEGEGGPCAAGSHSEEQRPPLVAEQAHQDRGEESVLFELD